MNTGTGVKLQPYADAKKIADAGCGGLDNKDPGVQIPTLAFAPGAQVPVEWKLTIPHPADNLRAGVRIALHYSATDSFKDNILAGTVVGDPPGKTPVAAGTANDAANALVTETVTLPAGKTCDYCTLQWMWSAEADGGSYIGCADISITTGGQLPNFATLPKQTGNILPGVPGQVYTAPGSGGGTGGGTGGGYYSPPPPYSAVGGGSGQSQTTASGECGLGGTTGFFLGLVLACVATPGAIYFYKKKQVEKTGGGTRSSAVVVQVGGAPGAPGAPQGVSGLPAGWSEATDPASGRVYYVNSATGQSSWTFPTA